MVQLTPAERVGTFQVVRRNSTTPKGSSDFEVAFARTAAGHHRSSRILRLRGPRQTCIAAACSGSKAAEGGQRTAGGGPPAKGRMGPSPAIRKGGEGQRAGQRAGQTLGRGGGGQGRLAVGEWRQLGWRVYIAGSRWGAERTPDPRPQRTAQCAMRPRHDPSRTSSPAVRLYHVRLVSSARAGLGAFSPFELQVASLFPCALELALIALRGSKT
jgi:hypothetical protein